jgi:AraC family transcriptional regulator of adaptative response/methylated-DNA-[protein]-cysteine methyltransferase
MAFEPGGISGKLGNRYEGRWVAKQLLRLLNEEIQSVTVELIGPEEEGVDLQVVKKDGVRQLQQCKARFGNENSWSVGTLASKGILDHLHKNQTVTQALYQAGFMASSRFYEKATATLGMQPRAYQKGAPHRRIQFTIVHSSLGPVLVAATDKGICAIEFGRSPETLQEQLRRRFPKAEFQEPDPHFKAMIKQVLAFLESPRKERFDLPLDIQGTAFQRQVWLALQKIPSGSTASYKDIAARIGCPRAARAVAQACAANPVAVAIPCHRVVRRNGEIGGYRWGIERKRKLLIQEKTRG